MKSAIFIVPFDPVTHKTTCPALEWVHKTPESNATVILQARDEDAVIDGMKIDPLYQWLEDVVEVADVSK